MTVAQYIEQLKKMPQDLEVKQFGADYVYYGDVDIPKVETVRLVKDRFTDGVVNISFDEPEDMVFFEGPEFQVVII